MKLLVATAREVADALNAAADEAMKNGAYEFEFDDVAMKTVNARWQDLRQAIEASPAA